MTSLKGRSNELMRFGIKKTSTFILQTCILGITLDAVLGKLYTGFNEPYPLNGQHHQECLAKGNRGICTFSWDCKQMNGTPTEICQEGALFGTCCTPPLVLNPLMKIAMFPGRLLFPFPSQRNVKECGKSLDLGEFESRVVNGVNANIGEFPWQASLRMVTPFPFTLSWCGAIVITRQWVLTAAHCTAGVPPRNLVVRFGSYSVFSSIDPGVPAERRAERVVIHPEFYKLSEGHDIALIKVEAPVNFNNFISPICLPGSGVGDLTGEKAIVTGWGRGLTEEDFPTFLQKAVVPIIDNKECQKMYQRENKRVDINSHFMCAGYQEGGTDSCQGDSGGPLQILGDDNRWFLAGVTSSGFMCAKPNLPGLYTRASSYVPWILMHIYS